MNKFEKGLSRNTRPQDQPPGTYPFGKNGVRILYGVNQNEPGFIQSAAMIPYTPIGVIETDKYPIIFSTDNINSAGGFYDYENDQYIPIFNDATYTYKLGFKAEFPINGQFQRNYKGESIVAFTDFNTFPKFLNCDKPVIKSLDDWRLFPFASVPTITTNVIDGGTLFPGGYYIFGKLVKNDGTETQFLVSSDVIVIGGTNGSSSGKAIEINFGDLDSDYDQVQVGIISKIDGIISASTLEPITIGSGNKATVIYTGANLSTEATIEELLVQPVIYNKVKTIGQLNDTLYLGNLTKDDEIKIQKYMLLAKIRWVSNLIYVNPRNEDHATAKIRSLMHHEVYAFYIRLSKTGGAGWTPLFHVPGVAPVSSDFDQSTEATYGGNFSGRRYQIEDTIRAYDANAKIGDPGTWVNINETYPDTDDYDASQIGGENLRGVSVRHHRMPSIRWCKKFLYSQNGEYGKSQLDLLGIKVSNIVIPNEYTSRLDGGYEIYYAKRSINNSTVIAQSALLFAARHGSGAGTTTISGPDTDYKTTGGNWNAQIDWSGNSRERPLVIDKNLFRFHAFDLLYNKPAISPKYLRQELFLRRENMPMIEDYSLTGGERDAPISYLIDYVKDGASPIPSADGTVIRKISDTPGDNPQYIPNNLITGKWYNLMAESAYGGKLVGPPLVDNNDISYHSLWTGKKWQRPDKSAQFERTYLSNLMNYTDNIYVPFNAQSLVRMAPRQTGSAPMFGGDVFVCDYSFNTYGWNDYDNGTYSKDSSRDPYMGIKVARRIVCESASNIYSRFEISGNIYSKWYPNSPLDIGDNNMFLNLFDRRIDPNQFGYSKDSNALNDIVTAIIFNPLKEEITVFPFRIHRAGKLNKQLKKRSWRTFLPLDYYEMQKNMGVIEHLEGMDDTLYIHCTNALFYTQGKMNLQQDLLSVVIGNGDIFQFEPQEKYSDKLGYAGTRHNLACVRTPMGYIFPDTGHGKIYVAKGELKLINEGLNQFFIENLRLKDNNPFIGNGITIGYDQRFERILFTCKNLIKPTGVRELQKTQEFIDSLTPGESLVIENGRLMRFLGISTDYQCTDLIPVIVGNVILTIPEDTPVDTVIHTIIPISGVNLSYYILSGNSDGALSVEASTGKIKVNNQGGINYNVRHQLVLQIKAVSTNGLSTTFQVTVNITKVNKAPISGPQQFTIPENSPNSTIVGTVVATDPDGSSLNYTITSGNDGGVFVLNGTTGQITVANGSLLDYETHPVYLLQVSISDGYNAITIPVTINITNVDEAPPLNDDVITIYDTTPTNTIVYQFITVDPEGDVNLVFDLVNASSPGVFTLNTATGEIKLIDNAYLNPATTPQITLTVRVIDTHQNSDEGTLTINILADPETLDFRPSSPSCSGGCPAGYVQTTDGLYCERFTTVPATPPTGGTPFSVVSSVNNAYSNFGALVYQPGFDNHGVGTIQQWLQQSVWRNAAANSVDGPLNRCGVWSASVVPNNEAIGFSVPITLTETAIVLVAISGDNKCKIAINGVVLVDQDPTDIGTGIGLQLPQFKGQGISLAFKFWHIYPFTVQAGTHYIGMEGVNFGGAASFGAEIYKNTIDELAAAQLDPAYISNPGTFPLNQNHYTNLNLLFSTRSTRGGTFDSGISAGYSCPVNYAMNGTTNPPTCVLVDRVPATTRVWSALQVYSLRLSQVIATLNNVAGQTFQGISVPYYPPVGDHIDCGGSKTVYYNTPKAASVSKNNCTDGVGSIVKYAVPGGIYTSTISQADADSKAQNDIDTNKQTYANENGYCVNEH